MFMSFFSLGSGFFVRYACQFRKLYRWLEDGTIFSFLFVLLLKNNFHEYIYF